MSSVKSSIFNENGGGGIIYKSSLRLLFLAKTPTNEREENSTLTLKSGSHVTPVISVLFVCHSLCIQQRQSSPWGYIFVCSLFVLQRLCIGKQERTECILCAQWHSPWPGWVNKVSCAVFMEELQCGCVPEGLLLITLVCDGGGTKWSWTPPGQYTLVVLVYVKANNLRGAERYAHAVFPPCLSKWASLCR